MPYAGYRLIYVNLSIVAYYIEGRSAQMYIPYAGYLLYYVYLSIVAYYIEGRSALCWIPTHLC